MILVIVHLLGVFAEAVLHSKTETLQSMVTGYKNMDGKNARLNGFHKVFVLLWLIVPFYFFFLAKGLQIARHEKENAIENNEHHKHKHDRDDDD